MTRRETILATTLVVILVVFGGGFVFHLFVYEPLSTVRAQLDSAREAYLKKQDELAAEQRQIDSVTRLNPRLNQWQKLSLPPRDPKVKLSPGMTPEELKKRHLADLKVDYQRYLTDLMDRNGLRSVVVKQKATERRGMTGPAVKGKQAPFERLAFGVTAQGSMDSLSRALKEFHTTDLLHQVRSVNVSLASARGRTQMKPGTLDVNLTVEALMVNGAEARSSLLPASSSLTHRPRVLAEPIRDYSRMDKRNMFTGIDPIYARRTEERHDVLRFVKLTTIYWNDDRKRWEATLYDQAKGGAEKKLDARLWNEFTIVDGNKNTMIEGKVVLIDERQLIFQADGKYYRMRVGDFIYPAIREEVKKEELVSLGITPDT
jgi:hypothetical protein